MNTSNKGFFDSHIVSATALGAISFLAVSQPALAHVEYYDLNQGVQIANLTAIGKTNSTAQYGQNPIVIGAGANGNAISDRPLNDVALWNADNQSYTSVGAFSAVTYDVNTGLGAATVDVNDVTAFGWGKGTQTTLGDSHKVDFFNFRLNTDATVTITWDVDTGALHLDNGFSLYRGVLSYQGHDGASADQLQPVKLQAGGVVRLQNIMDTGNQFDVQGIASAFRNTGPGSPNYVGQFNALDNWGQGNEAGNWSNVEFIAAANSRNTGITNKNNLTMETMVIQLAAGNYTIAASGASGAVANAEAGTLGSTYNSTLTNLHGHLTYSAVAAPVPLPATAWSFLFGLTGMLAVKKRGARPSTSPIR